MIHSGGMGLKIIAFKTKTMSSLPGNPVYSIASPAFSRRLAGKSLTYSARKRQK
jgi:hypothetical protein